MQGYNPTQKNINGYIKYSTSRNKLDNLCLDIYIVAEKMLICIFINQNKTLLDLSLTSWYVATVNNLCCWLCSHLQCE